MEIIKTENEIKYVVYINCMLFPFITWIIKGLKLYETRNRNTLKRLIGKTVYFAETGKGKNAIIKCYCTIGQPVFVKDKKTYNQYRKYTKVKKGSCFDFTRETKQKVLYPLLNVQPVKIPFEIPENAIRKNRTFCELI